MKLKYLLILPLTFLMMHSAQAQSSSIDGKRAQLKAAKKHKKRIRRARVMKNDDFRLERKTADSHKKKLRRKHRKLLVPTPMKPTASTATVRKTKRANIAKPIKMDRRANQLR